MRARVRVIVYLFGRTLACARKRISRYSHARRARIGRLNQLAAAAVDRFGHTSIASHTRRSRSRAVRKTSRTAFSCPGAGRCAGRDMRSQAACACACAISTSKRSANVFRLVRACVRLAQEVTHTGARTHECTRAVRVLRRRRRRRRSAPRIMEKLPRRVVAGRTVITVLRESESVRCVLNERARIFKCECEG